MKTPIRAAALAALLALGHAPGVRADGFTDAVERALSAYRADDFAGARSALDQAGRLLAGRKTEALGDLLPPPPAGWTREEASVEGPGAAVATFGGGSAAAAVYRRDGEEVTLTLVADAPMVGAVSSMVSGMAAFAGFSRSIHGTDFTEIEGRLQGVVAGRVLVAATGSAPAETKATLIEAMDFDRLAAF